MSVNSLCNKTTDIRSVESGVSPTLTHHYFYLLIRENLKLCWDEKTTFAKDYSGGSHGQCYVTALLLNHFFGGGDIICGWVVFRGKRLHHFWNKIDNQEVDLTSDQFEGDGIFPIIKGKVFTKPNFTNLRYKKLLERYNAI